MSMNNRTEKHRPVLIKPSIHKELRMLSVTNNMKVQHLVNFLLEVILNDKQKVEELLLEYQSNEDR